MMKDAAAGQPRRRFLLLAALGLALVAGVLIFGAPHQLDASAGGGSSGKPWQAENDAGGLNSPLTALPTRFYDAAAALRNAKVTPPGGDGYWSHHYQYIFDKYLGHLTAGTRLRILEIGLGCGMPQEWGGVGNSLKLWKALFPHAAISFIEFDAKCGKELQAEIEATGGRLFPGSQADAKVLAAAVEWANQTGAFDLIVDDGSHDPRHQRQSLEGLWPALRPGGVYVVEDLLTSYWKHQDVVGAGEGAFIPFIKDAIDAMNCHSAMPENTAQNWRDYCAQPRLGKQFLAVECGAEICAVLKHRTPPPAGYTV